MTVKSPDKKWFDELIVELRFRDVYGAAIGDTVASARELLADTGQGAEEAFGPARTYAASLELPRAPKNGLFTRGLVASIFGLIAFTLFVQVTGAWLRDEAFLVSPLQLALFAGLVSLVGLMPLYLEAMIRRMWLAIPIFVIGPGLGALSAYAAPATPADAWLTLAPLPWIIGSALTLVVLSAWNTIRTIRRGTIDDITEPLTALSARTGRRSRVFMLIINWLFPILALVMLGLLLLLNALPARA
jgi:hypothetical protein